MKNNENLVIFENNEENYWDDYFYPKTNVLKNLFGIKEEKKFKKIEDKITKINLLKYQENICLSIECLDLDFYKNIHKQIFHNIYSWAGEFRKVEIGKNNTHFLSYQNIEKELNKLFLDLKKKNFLKDKSKNKEEFIDEILKFYLKLNFIHPFREGNGRTQNEFVRQLCEYNGYYYSFENVDNYEYNKAFEAYSLLGDNKSGHDVLKEFIFNKAIKTKEERNLELDLQIDLNKHKEKSFFEKIMTHFK